MERAERFFCAADMRRLALALLPNTHRPTAHIPTGLYRTIPLLTLGLLNFIPI